MPATLLVSLLSSLLATGCDPDATAERDAAAAEYVLPEMPPPKDFVSDIEHPYLPLRPGARWVYRQVSPEGEERIVVTVLAVPRVVAGVTATVVHDRVTLDGRLVEDTYDWFAQDRTGNVWYLGEDTTAYAPGEAPSKEGSWEAGIDGAEAGIALPGRPRIGDRYQQEYLRGVAEDRGEVVDLDSAGTVPWGTFRDAIRTRDTTPLEPDLVEFKYYVRDVGNVLEESDGDRVELVSFRPGRS